MSAQLEKRGEPSSPPLERRPSRLTSALAHVKSIEQYPPPANRAHFEDDDEDEQGSQSATASVTAGPPPKALVVDIEHVPVDNDPREWSTTKKNIVLAMMTIAVVRFLDAQGWIGLICLARAADGTKYLQPSH